MTVASQRTTHRYLGDGVQNLWPILFKFLDPEHVRALKTSVDGVTTSLVYGSEYTVEVLEGGGQCSAQLKDGEQITLYLDVPLTQETDLRDSGRLAPDVLERMVDKLTLALQQQKEDVERCVRVPPESAETPDDYVKQIIDVKEQAVQLKGTAESAVAETLAYKELSEEQVGRAVAEVAKAQRAVDDAEQILGSVQSAVSGLDTSIRESVSEEITPVVNQARAEFDVIKNQVVGYRNQSAQHVALATEKVTAVEGVAADAERLLGSVQSVVSGLDTSIRESVSKEMTPVVNQAKEELNVIKGQVVGFKNQSAQQAALATEKVTAVEGVVADAERLLGSVQSVVSGLGTSIRESVSEEMTPVVNQAKEELNVIKGQVVGFKNQSAQQAALATEKVTAVEGVVADAERLLGSVQSVVSGLDTSIRESVSEEMTPVVNQAKAEFNVIKGQVVGFKNQSAQQAALATEKVTAVEGVVADAERLLGSVQSVVSGLDTSIRESVSEEMTPVVTQAKAELNVIKGQVVGFKNQSAQQAALATEKVTIAERVVGDADKLLSEARVLITRAEQLVEDAASGSGSELLSGMVIPFKGTLTGSGFPLDRITGAENRQYAVCDGRTYTAPDGTRITTPDLRDRFITGAGRTYSQGNIGGVNNVVLSVEQLPAHTHSLRAGTGDTSGEYTFNDIATVVRSKTGMRTVTAAGGSKPHENRPPYYALAYLMKL